MIVRVKRLYNGYASVRSYLVRQCMDNHEKMLIICDANGEQMVADLSNLKQISEKLYPSKFGSPAYRLYDFKWKGVKR